MPGDISAYFSLVAHRRASRIEAEPDGPNASYPIIEPVVEPAIAAMRAGHTPSKAAENDGKRGKHRQGGIDAVKHPAVTRQQRA